MSGCLKLLFTRATDRVECIVINSSGGLTSGDRLSLTAQVEEGATASLTTQAAERAYRATTGAAQVENRLSVAPGGQLYWLPQELILFDGADLARTLHCDLAPEARLLLVEPVIFGRARMGERIKRLSFQDRIRIDRAGTPLFRDTTYLSGDIRRRLGASATARGAGAMASLFYVAPDAPALAAQLAPGLSPTAGLSLVQEDLLFLRLLAEDGFELRRSLLPILDRLTRNTLPTCWRL